MSAGITCEQNFEPFLLYKTLFTSFNAEDKYSRAFDFGFDRSNVRHTQTHKFYILQKLKKGTDDEVIYLWSEFYWNVPQDWIKCEYSGYGYL